MFIPIIFDVPLSKRFSCNFIEEIILFFSLFIISNVIKLLFITEVVKFIFPSPNNLSP